MYKSIKNYFIIFLSFITIEYIAAQASPRISIQGILKDANGSAIADGTYSVTFKLYNQAVGGNALWSEEASIDVAGGIYNHFLGSVQPLNSSNFSATLFVGVKIGAYELAPRAELTYAPYAFSVLEAVCSGAVGDIKYSILNPTQFAAVNGSCWVPMDGRSIANSNLGSILNINNLPDGGGVFLRAQEFAGGANNDPDRTTASPIVTFQDHAILSHNHTLNDPGHSHSFSDKYRALNGVNYPVNDGPHATVESSPLDSTPNSSNHVTTGITVSPSGGSETRPKNMNFWIYTRIN